MNESATFHSSRIDGDRPTPVCTQITQKIAPLNERGELLVNADALKGLAELEDHIRLNADFLIEDAKKMAEFAETPSKPTIETCGLIFD